MHRFLIGKPGWLILHALALLLVFYLGHLMGQD
jgi:hypothetical protein